MTVLGSGGRAVTVLGSGGRAMTVLGSGGRAVTVLGSGGRAVTVLGSGGRAVTVVGSGFSRIRSGAAWSLFVAMLLFATGCARQETGRAAGPAPAPVSVGQVVRKSAPLTVTAIGHVEAISNVLVRARVGGELTRVWFREGQDVGKGDTLFSIDARPYQAVLREAEAKLARNEALLKKAEIDATRYEGLVKQDYVTREQYDQLTTNVVALKAQIEADRATVESARLQVAYCTISAPVAGRTGSLAVRVGNLVGANDPRALVTINQTRPIYVGFSVPAQFLPEIQKRSARRLRVTAVMPESGVPAHEGELTFIDNAVDTASSTILLKATFPNADETLWPGQFVNVVLSLGDEPDRVVAPSPAVQASQQGQYVFIVGSDGAVEQRLVKVSRSDDKEAIIEAGLSGGETVVTDGHLRVVPGGKVAVRNPAAGK